MPSKRDDKLIEWLKNIGCDNLTIKRFVDQELTYDNVLKSIDRDDLKRLGLKLGVEITIWNEIYAERMKQRQLANNQTESTEDNKPESTQNETEK